MIRGVKQTLALLLVGLFLNACAVSDPAELPAVRQQDVSALTSAIQSLGPNVDPAEAVRAAQIAYTYPRQLAIEYQITDSPLIHNTKVNAGTRPRGLCWHWAEDMNIRLAKENFKTLDLHSAIGNSNKALRIDHSTVLISAKGATMNEGLVLDPWRYGGLLYWGPPLEDTRYDWIARAEVFAARL